MKKILMMTLLAVALFACKNKETENQNPTEQTEENALFPDDRSDLITIKNGQYIEYYPDKKHIKFRGFVDENNERDGKWIFYGMDGTELSVGFYKNGKRDGHVIVKFPNGKLRYVGEYALDKKVGEWELYDEKGNKTLKKYD